MKIAIIGAGYIGLYVGARLLEAGGDVVFVGRERMKAHLRQHGLKVNSYQQKAYQAPSYTYLTDYRELGLIDYALISCKTTQTEAVLADLRPHLGKAKIINLQNGVDNREVFRAQGLEDKLIEGMVTFNVAVNEKGELYQATNGPVIIEDLLAQELVALFTRAKLEFKVTTNVTGYKWSKLLLNLNNSVNAIAGIPIKAEIEQRGYRLVLARLMDEALAVIDAKGIRLEKLTPVNFRIVPFVLRLPTFLFKLVAKQMVNIDPLAKSSMLVDMERNGPTEIDFLNAKVVSNARALGLAAPANEKIVELIRAAGTAGSPKLAAEELCRRLSL